MIIWLTGCTAGLGKALVKEFSAAGHTIVGGGRNEKSLKKLTNQFQKSTFLKLDVSEEESVREFCKNAFQAHGAPDFLINNAAIINPNAPLWEITAEAFDQLVSINISGVANMIRHTVPLMSDRKRGIIVNLSSGWGRSTSPEVAPYCASKWAIEGLTKALAQELPAGLAAIPLNPGVINTEMLQMTYGASSEHHRSAEEWAVTAAPFITKLTVNDNGQSLTAP